MEIFLRAKHWQLFILMFGLPFIFQMVIMIAIFSQFVNNPQPDPTVIFSYIKSIPVIMLLFMGIFFGWFWAVAIGLQSKVPPTVKMKTGKFKIFFFIPLIYILIIVITLSSMFSGAIEANTLPDPVVFAIAIPLIFPLHLFSMFCMFYCLYFVAKTFKTVELQREVSFSDFVGEFFMIWFYPIGIWIIQPKINKMIEDNHNRIF